MCVVSNKVKFCTCKNAENLKHYWVLHRFNKNKNEMIMGQPLFPVEFILYEYFDNQETFLKRLNEPDAFDIPIEFKTKDHLEIVLNSNNHETPHQYAFKYTKGKWVITEYETFDLMSRFDVFEEGKFKNLLKK